MGCCLGDLQDKEVINVCDGRRLGYICDVEADVCTGQIRAILLPGERCSLFGRRGRCIRIPWEKICRIGDDLILVQLSAAELCPPPDMHPPKKHFWEG